MSGRPSVVVVGGGLTGLAVARQLAVGGIAQVDVVEAGERAAADHMNAIHSVQEIERLWRIPGADTTLWRPWDSLGNPHYGGATGLRRQLGGRSLYWHGVVLRLESWTLATSGWPRGLAHAPDDGACLYDALEQELSVWSGRPLQGERSTSEESLLAWMRSIGYPAAERTPLAVQRFETDRGPRWRAYSPLYAGRAIDQPQHGQDGLGISTGELVEGISMARGRPSLRMLTRATQQRRCMEASAVVLAAGTVENTRLVAQLLAERNPTPARFGGLSDHIVQGFAVVVPRAPWGGGEGAYLMVKGGAENRSNLFVKLQEAPDPASVTLTIFEMGEQEPSELNSISFPDRDSLPWRPVR